ncbi:MAG TPA: protein-disulfide reductase DsbD domain-containing protein, partial [Microvirga sp.]|nr:protein-disulfide reductase DsbD domain-containing protein [Microvirga sp.]
AAGLHWPAPDRTEDAGGIAHTYADRVVFPVSITPADPAKPVKLRLFMEYGVCKDICIPARAELSLVLGGGARKRPVIEEALARVPRKRPLGAEGPLAILGAETALGEKRTLTIRVRAPADAVLFAEGPENWYLSTSPPHGDRFTVTVEDRPKGAHAVSLRLTLAGGGEAIETEIHLDDSLRPR